MGSCPENLLYTPDHLWIGRETEGHVLGLTDQGVERFGGIVYVGLPPIGTHLRVGDVLASLESSHKLFEILSPVSGKITDVNDVLMDSPAWINEDAYASWLIRISVDEIPGGLLTAQQYQEKLEADD